MKPQVSVIIPFYNSEEYLSNCIKSLLNQTFTNIEIILVNDFSTDSSEKIIKELASVDNRIKLIESISKGANIARYTGVKIAQGEYIIFSDSDDLWDKMAIEKLLDIAISTKVEMVASNIKFVPLGNNKSQRTKPYSIFKFKVANKIIQNNKSSKALLYYSSNIVAKLIKSSCFKDITFENVPFCQDWNISYKIFSRIENFYFLDEDLYIYISRQNSTSSFNKKNAKIETIIKAEKSYEGIVDFYKSEKLLNKYKEELKYIGILFFFTVLHRSHLNNDFFKRRKYHKRIKKKVRHYQLSHNNKYFNTRKSIQKIAFFSIHSFLLSEVVRFYSKFIKKIKELLLIRI